jgi:hypothetical protein
MKSKQWWIALPLVCVAVFSTCSGGGGGGSSFHYPAPALLAASFAGSGVDPAAGDTLRLVMSEAVTFDVTSFDAADLSISGGGSLGVLTVAPVVTNSLVVEIVLGAGASLTTGVTTIDFAVANDVIRDLSGLTGVSSTAKTLTKADIAAPVITELTLAGVNRRLNGSGSAGGTLQTATNGFTVDVGFSDLSAISVASSIISADRAIFSNGVSLAAGENLAGDFVTTTSSGNISFTVPSTMQFLTGAHTLTVRILDISGQISQPSTFAFLAKPLTTTNRPFENGQLWFLDTSRDLESYTFSLGSPTATAPIAVVPGANGRSDLEDLFRILGIQSNAPLANVSGSKNSNEVAMEIFEARVQSALAEFFGGVGITFTFTSPGVFPGSTTVPYASHSFSRISLAGAHEANGTSGVLGLAIFDPQNQFQEDNTETSFQGSRLGVFLHTLISSGEQSNALTAFRNTYDALTPARGGSPIGLAGDAVPLVAMLNGNPVSGSRGLVLEQAIQDMARFTALVVAHECGHSMGLVTTGAMPAGLYGGDPVNFPQSQEGHIAMPDSVFPGNAINVMTPMVSYEGGVATASGFNSLNLAYLREQVVHN